jgi:Putative Ig domain
LASIAALFGASVATAPPAVPQVVPACTFGGVPAGGAIDVTPGVTSVAISCTGLPINSQVFVADASPLAGVLTVPNIADQLNLTMGFALALTDGAGNLNTSFLIPAATVGNNTDGPCPPTQAQVNTGLTNCALAVASLTGTPFGFVLLNYPGQPSPPTPNLTLNPTSGDVGTSVTVSGSGWWGSGTADNPPTVTVGGVAATTSTANVPHGTYTVGVGPFGSGGTLTGSSLTGAFTIPSGVACGPQPVVVTQTNMHPANNAPYTGVPISATATFQMPPCPVDVGPVTSDATATIDRNVSNTATVTLPATDNDGTPTASCSAGTPSDLRLTVSVGAPTASGCPATLMDTGGASQAPAGPITFTFTAVDTVGNPSTPAGGSTVTVTIVPVPHVAITQSGALPGGQVGVPYSTTLTATGGTSPFTWSVSSGTLPDGLGLSSAGVISGTPTTPGLSSFTVMVTDSDTPAETATANLSIDVITVQCDASMNAIAGNPRSAAGHKTVVAKVTNVGTGDCTVSDTNISWSMLVGATDVTGSVTPLNPGTVTLAPGASKRFRFSWDYGATLTPFVGSTVDITATVTIAGDVGAGNNSDTEPQTVK